MGRDIYRFIYWIDEDERIVYVDRVDHRRDDTGRGERRSRPP